MPVGDEVKALIGAIFLQADPIFQRAKIVTDVQTSGGPHAGNDTLTAAATLFTPRDAVLYVPTQQYGGVIVENVDPAQGYYDWDLSFLANGIYRVYATLQDRLGAQVSMTGTNQIPGVVQVWAPEDREPPWEGELELEDAESGENIELAFDAGSREQYTAAFDQYALALRQVALRNQGRYVGIPTNIPVEDAIFGSLMRSGAVQ